MKILLYIITGLLSVQWAAADQTTVIVKPYCKISSNSVSFESIIETKYTPNEEENTFNSTHSVRVFWSISCKKSGDNECYVRGLNLRNLEGGEPISGYDIIGNEYPTKLVSFKDNIATIQSNLDIFTIDFSAQQISHKHSSSRANGAGSGACHL